MIEFKGKYAFVERLRGSRFSLTLLDKDLNLIYNKNTTVYQGNEEAKRHEIITTVEAEGLNDELYFGFSDNLPVERQIEIMRWYTSLTEDQKQMITEIRKDGYYGGLQTD